MEEGSITMSKKELTRLVIVRRVIDKRMRQAVAASPLPSILFQGGGTDRCPAIICHLQHILLILNIIK